MPKKPSKPKPTQCDAWRRRGGAFTLGPVQWEQCKNDAVVLLTVRNPDGSVVTDSPACMECWKEGQETEGMKQLAAKPIVGGKPK